MKLINTSLTRFVLPLALIISGISTDVSALNSGQFFYAGLHTGPSFINNESRNNYIADSNLILREDSEQRGFNGGILFGFNFYSCNQFLLAAEVSGIYYSNRGHFTEDFYDNSTTSNHIFETSYDLNYSVSLTLRPGYLINKSTLLYFQGGITYACFNSELENLKPSTATPFSDKFSDDEGEWGATLGVGIQKQLCGCWSVFGAYQFTYYGKFCLTDGGSGGSFSDPDVRIINREQLLTENTFKFGVIYTF